MGIFSFSLGIKREQKMGNKYFRATTKFLKKSKTVRAKEV